MLNKPVKPTGDISSQWRVQHTQQHRTHTHTHTFLRQGGNRSVRLVSRVSLRLIPGSQRTNGANSSLDLRPLTSPNVCLCVCLCVSSRRSQAPVPGPLRVLLPPSRRRRPDHSLHGLVSRVHTHTHTHLYSCDSVLCVLVMTSL